MADTDATLATIQDGQAARIVRGQTEDWLMEREEQLLHGLVNAYRSDTLTNDMLRGSIGEISGLRSFRAELESKIRRGVMTAEKELGNG